MSAAIPDAESPGPLAGVRVIEVGQLIAGPYASGLLADHGADVIKIEAPGAGDVIRASNAADGNGFWAVEGRNKRCVTLDLRVPRAAELFLGLVARADVVLENLRPGTLDRWGFPESALRTANPDVIIARVSGYGQDGPYRERPCTDRQALAFSGVAHLTGFPDGPPVRVGVPISDFVAGLHTAFGIMTALYHRDTGPGPGQTVDVSLFEGMFRMTSDLVHVFARRGVQRERSGNSNPAVPGGIFAACDGVWIAIAASTDRLWLRLAGAMDRPDLAADPELATNDRRALRREQVEGVLSDWVAARPAAEVERALAEHGVPANRVHTAADILADPQYRERGALIDIESEDGIVTMPGVVAHLSRTPGRVRHAGRTVGADNPAVYGELLGLDAGHLAELRRDGVI